MNATDFLTPLKRATHAPGFSEAHKHVLFATGEGLLLHAVGQATHALHWLTSQHEDVPTSNHREQLCLDSFGSQQFAKAPHPKAGTLPAILSARQSANHFLPMVEDYVPLFAGQKHQPIFWHPLLAVESVDKESQVLQPSENEASFQFYLPTTREGFQKRPYVSGETCENPADQL